MLSRPTACLFRSTTTTILTNNTTRQQCRSYAKRPKITKLLEGRNGRYEEEVVRKQFPEPQQHRKMKEQPFSIEDPNEWVPPYLRDDDAPKSAADAEDFVELSERDLQRLQAGTLDPRTLTPKKKEDDAAAQSFFDEIPETETQPGEENESFSPAYYKHVLNDSMDETDSKLDLNKPERDLNKPERKPFATGTKPDFAKAEPKPSTKPSRPASMDEDPSNAFQVAPKRQEPSFQPLSPPPPSASDEPSKTKATFKPLYSPRLVSSLPASPFNPRLKPHFYDTTPSASKPQPETSTIRSAPLRRSGPPSTNTEIIRPNIIPTHSDMDYTDRPHKLPPPSTLNISIPGLQRGMIAHELSRAMRKQHLVRNLEPVPKAKKRLGILFGAPGFEYPYFPLPVLPVDKLRTEADMLEMERDEREQHYAKIVHFVYAPSVPYTYLSDEVGNTIVGPGWSEMKQGVECYVSGRKVHCYPGGQGTSTGDVSILGASFFGNNPGRVVIDYIKRRVSINFSKVKDEDDDY
ncbi:hypothetical protein BJ508DRAFT_416544 [Ascobolus immersus RN42]|uniref:Uncharacterized protein n=1 Tax=Ascobolus immersus RN42 TaxID=1160509 RepID=A0A3N4HZB0_ASCIM|nr:hypothetical protein BJ508DRAFT_416544 [Ascobolus immersus RN42]